MSFKDQVKIGDQSMTASLAVWGLLLLAVTALVLTIVASIIGRPSSPGQEFPGFGEFPF